MRKRYIWLFSSILSIESIFISPTIVEAGTKELIFEIIVYGGTATGVVGALYKLIREVVHQVRRCCHGYEPSIDQQDQDVEGLVDPELPPNVNEEEVKLKRHAMVRSFSTNNLNIPESKNDDDNDGQEQSENHRKAKIRNCHSMDLPPNYFNIVILNSGENSTANIAPIAAMAQNLALMNSGSCSYLVPNLDNNNAIPHRINNSIIVPNTNSNSRSNRRDCEASSSSLVSRGSSNDSIGSSGSANDAVNSNSLDDSLSIDQELSSGANLITPNRRFSRSLSSTMDMRRMSNKSMKPLLVDDE